MELILERCLVIFAFEFQGQSHQAEAEIINGQLWIHFQDKTWCIEKTKSGTKSRGSKKVNKQNEITAPMPGKIIKIAVKENDRVEIGQVLVIMEAMKMEYTLKASRQAQIQKINVQSGQQVKLGETLVEFIKKGTDE